MCKSHQEGKCQDGVWCAYAHTKEEQNAARKRYEQAMKERNKVGLCLRVM